MVKKTNTHTVSRQLLLGTSFGFLVLAVYAYVAQMMNWEVRIFYWFYNLPYSWRQIMLALTMLGSSWMIVIISLALFVRRKTRLSVYVLAVGLVTYGVSEIIKVIVVRPRPYEILVDVTSRERFVSGLGFPSGHTAVATVISLVLLPYLPKQLRWTVPVWIMAVAISRVYLGVHAPLDVVGGFLLGVLLWQCFWLVHPVVKAWFRRLK